jgi:hypothetical protein
MKDSNTTERRSPDLSFSLLWPRGTRTATVEIREQSALDLGLQKLIEFMAFNAKHCDALREIVRFLCQDADTINYRLDIIDELARFPKLVRCIESLLPVLRDLKYYETFLALEWKTSLQETIWRLRELEHYVDCLSKLAAAFKGIRGELRSEALRDPEGAGGSGIPEAGGCPSGPAVPDPQPEEHYHRCQSGRRYDALRSHAGIDKLGRIQGKSFL